MRVLAAANGSPFSGDSGDFLSIAEGFAPENVPDHAGDDDRNREPRANFLDVAQIFLQKTPELLAAGGGVTTFAIWIVLVQATRGGGLTWYEFMASLIAVVYAHRSKGAASGLSALPPGSAATSALPDGNGAVASGNVTLSPREVLTNLLVSLFNDAEFRMFIVFLPRDVTGRLPGSGTPMAYLALEFVLLLEREGLLEPVLTRLRLNVRVARKTYEQYEPCTRLKSDIR